MQHPALLELDLPCSRSGLREVASYSVQSTPSVHPHLLTFLLVDCMERSSTFILKSKSRSPSLDPIKSSQIPTASRTAASNYKSAASCQSSEQSVITHTSIPGKASHSCTRSSARVSEKDKRVSLTPPCTCNFFVSWWQLAALDGADLNRSHSEADVSLMLLVSLSHPNSAPFS